MGFAAVLRAAVGASRSSERSPSLLAWLPLWLRRRVSLLRRRRAADRSVAVIVVPRFAPSAYADRGAVGLLVPGAGSTVSRERALASLVRGRVVSSLVDLDGTPAIQLADRPATTTIYVSLPPPGSHHNVTRYPVAIIGPGYRGVLTSGSTRDRRARLARGHRAHCERDRSGRDAADPLPSRPRRGRHSRPSRRAAHTRPRRPHGRDARARRLARRVRGTRYPRPPVTGGPCRRARRSGRARHGTSSPRGRHRSAVDRDRDPCGRHGVGVVPARAPAVAARSCRRRLPGGVPRRPRGLAGGQRAGGDRAASRRRWTVLRRHERGRDPPARAFTRCCGVQPASSVPQRSGSCSSFSSAGAAPAPTGEDCWSSRLRSPSCSPGSPACG